MSVSFINTVTDAYGNADSTIESLGAMTGSAKVKGVLEGHYYRTGASSHPTIDKVCKVNGGWKVFVSSGYWHHRCIVPLSDREFGVLKNASQCWVRHSADEEKDRAWFEADQGEWVSLPRTIGGFCSRPGVSEESQKWEPGAVESDDSDSESYYDLSPRSLDD